MLASKICGVTRVEDARLAWDAGADALGLNFYSRSPRCVTPETAALLARTRPPLGAVVGVFVNESPDLIRDRVRECGLTAVQLHGDEPPEACSGYGVPVIKALRVRGARDVERARTYVGAGDVAALLLDGAAPGYGGGGVGFDWSLVARLARRGLPVLVAGGLTPANVGSRRAGHPALRRGRGERGGVSPGPQECERGARLRARREALASGSDGRP